MEFSGCLNDDSFGPNVRGCRGDFDFTLHFEKIFLSIIPSAVFTALAVTRILYLTRKPVIIHGFGFKYVKLFAAATYTSLQLALLVFVGIKTNRMTDLFISSSSLTVVAALCVCGLSPLEHSRSPRPSMLLGVFLFLTTLFDVTQTRSIFLSAHTHDEVTYAGLLTAGTALKAVMILLESREKRRWLRWDFKDHSPEETTGLYGLGAFFWLNSLFLTGYNKVLTIPDLFALDINMSAELLQASFAREIERTDLKSQKFGLIKALGKTLAVPLMLPVAPRIALIGFNFCQPFLLSTLLNHLESPKDSSSANVGYGLIGATLLVYMGIAISMAFYWYFQERTLYMARGCLASAIYKKTTETRLSAEDDAAAVTLMSTDIERIRLGTLSFHEFWANPIEVALAAWLLSRQLGAAFAAPIVVVILCALAMAVVARLAGPRQKEWMAKIQKRVGLTANVIANMKHLKISGLAGPVEKAIQQLRVDEITSGGRFRMIIILAVTIAFTPLLLAPVFTFAVTSKTLDVTTIYTSLSFLILLSNPLSMLFQFVPEVLASLTCLQRMQAFLMKESRDDFREIQGGKDQEKEKSGANKEEAEGGSSPAIRVIGGSFGWEEEKYIVKDMDVSIPSSKLTIVVGPIASGKSTLCKALLGETPYYQGRVILDKNFRKVGFCDQTPFLWNASIQENIIGFSDFDEKRYSDVIDATMLSKDLSLLPQGDKTKVGSNGITLSGGQKQRVSIARALYLESDLLIFDDILSGLDADTEEQVFNRTFSDSGLLKRRNATTILCTHSVRHLPNADYIIALGTDGQVVEDGNFTDLLANKKYVHSLGVKESSRSGDSTPPPESAIETQQQLARAKTAATLDATSPTNNQARQLGDLAVYKHYFKIIGPLWQGLFLVVGLGCGFLYNWPTIWFSFWSKDATSAHPVHSNAFYLGLYGTFQVLGLCCMFLDIFICFRILIRISGTILHRDALHTVITAPLRFFTTTDAGVVTNLFSQDMTLIDGDLPQALLNTSLELFICVGMAGVIATSSPYIVISYPFVIAILFAIQKFYLRTSRQLRLLDLEAKSPLYTNFLDTIKGVATIRAFGWSDPRIALNNTLLDTSQRPAYLLAMIQRWLGFVLNTVVCVLGVLIVTLATQMQQSGSSSSNSAFTGAGLVTLMSMGDFLSHLVQMYTALETSIGAVSRLKAFSENTAPEDLPGEDVVPEESWPKKGRIEIRGVSASYGDPQSAPESDSSGTDTATADALALRDLTLTIEPGQKVAICGRSGSGKSSTILLLLRLLDPLPSTNPITTATTTSSMTIDNIPLHTIDRDTLRRRIIAVPQDAVFLPDGTSFKTNLDPFDASTDDECRAILEAVDLWAFVSARGGLDGGLAADTLSHGQKQLFSLARAMLKKRVRARRLAGEVGEDYVSGSGSGEKSSDGKEKQTGVVGGGILLLDEVSSSVDVETDRAMQKIIQREFEGYTIVMVSHRLDMVIEFDSVVVMDTGRVVEQGRPRELVEREGSRFRELWLVGNRE